MSCELILLLMLVSVFAGFVDAIAGGGGLITVPALLLAGLSPSQAVATNKFQATFGVGFAAFTYYKAGKIDFESAKWPLVAAVVGAISGGFAVQYFSQDILKFFLPFILLFVAAYFALLPFLNIKPKQRVSFPSFALCAVMPVGFYDGFFGPGTGSFYLMAITSLVGLDLVKSTALTKALNFTSNFASLLVFLFSDKIIWVLAFAMLVGQLCGAYFGVKAALKFQAKLIRPLVICVCCALSCKLLFFS